MKRLSSWKPTPYQRQVVPAHATVTAWQGQYVQPGIDHRASGLAAVRPGLKTRVNPVTQAYPAQLTNEVDDIGGIGPLDWYLTLQHGLHSTGQR
jgi:hypothetical protein